MSDWLQGLGMAALCGFAVAMAAAMLTVAYIGGPVRPFADSVTRATIHTLEAALRAPDLWLARNF